MPTMTSREIVSGEIRAHMARQFKRTSGVAELLNISAESARRIIKGQRAINMNELYVISQWLEVYPHDLVVTGALISDLNLRQTPGPSNARELAADVADAVGKPEPCWSCV